MIKWEEIIQNSSLIAIAEQAGAHFHKSNGEYRSACPLHGGTNKTAFSVFQSGDRWRWKCYSRDCGGGDVIDFVAAWQHTDPKGAYEWLGGDQHIAPDQARAMAEERAARAAAFANQKREEYEKALGDLRRARSWEIYCTNRENNDAARELWRNRGIPDDWQNYWSLGYDPDFAYKHDDQLYHSPSLTIPIFNGGDQPVNIRHRLLQPIDPQDKYRPDRPGLKALPFVADPVRVDLTDKALVVEGEIKAMVSYLWLNDDAFQVYGIPGKSSFGDLAARLKDRQVWILFDPDASDKARDAALQVDGRIIELTMKIDDALNGGMLNRAGLRTLMDMARKV